MDVLKGTIAAAKRVSMKRVAATTDLLRGVPCLLAVLAIQANVAALLLLPHVQFLLPLAVLGLPAVLAAGFAGAVAQPLLRATVRPLSGWIGSFVPIGVIVGLVRCAIPETSCLAQWGLPHLPFALVAAAVGAAPGVWCGARLAKRSVRVKDGVRFGVWLALLSLFTLCLYVWVTYANLVVVHPR